ncbi:hypothetical protein AB6D11_00840 [Vibrio splendidus]
MTITDASIPSSSSPGFDIKSEARYGGLNRDFWFGRRLQNNYPGADDVAYGSSEEYRPLFGSITGTSKSGIGVTHNIDPNFVHWLYNDAGMYQTFSICIVMTDDTEVEQEGVTILENGYIYVRE